MRLLALDTASASHSVALLEDERIVAFEGLAAPRGSSDRVLALVAAVLSAARTALVEIDAVGVARGPGSLTGLRVGIGTARGIATGAGKPLVGVSTLQALAAGMGAGSPVLALIDAGREEVYGNLFRPADPPRAAGEERVGPPSWFAEAVAGREVRIAGNGAARYQWLFPNAEWLPTPGEEFLAAGVARVAAAAVRGVAAALRGQTAVVLAEEGVSRADAPHQRGTTGDGARRREDQVSTAGTWDASPRYLRRCPPPIVYEG